MVNIGLTLSLTKALCDATIEIAGAMGPPPVKALAKVYGETQDYIEFRQAATSGNNYDAGKYLAKKAAGLGGEKVADVVDLQMVSVDGIRAAVTGNGVDSAKSIADYGVKLTEMGAKYKNASPQTIQYIDQGKAVIKAGFALYKVYEEYADMKLSDENFEKMRKVQMATINTFDAQINGLLKVIVECGKQRGIKEPSSSSIPDLKMPYKGPTIGSARR